MRHFQSQYLSVWLYLVNQKSPIRSAFLRSVIHFLISVPYTCVLKHVQNCDLCTQDIVWTIAKNLGPKVERRKVVHTISERLDKVKRSERAYKRPPRTGSEIQPQGASVGHNLILPVAFYIRGKDSRTPVQVQVE